MPRFFNLVRRRNKQPIVMSYVDEIKDEEVLRVVKHVRSRAGLPALPSNNGGTESSGTMTTEEESDDRSVGRTYPSAQPKESLALVAEVGKEMTEAIHTGPSSMRAAATVDPKMIATPSQNLKKASSTRSWVKRASINLSGTKKFESFLPGKDKGERQQPQETPIKTSVPSIDTTHVGSISPMDSPTRYLTTTPKTPQVTETFFCAPSLTCGDHAWTTLEPDDRTVYTTGTDASWISWASRIRKTEQKLGISFIDNVLDHIVGEEDTFDGGTVMDESTVGPSLIFSPESSKQKLAETPASTSEPPSTNTTSGHKGAQRLMGKLAQWDEMDKLNEEEESCTLFDGKDATDRTLALEFSQSAGSEYTSDFFTDDEETEMTGVSAQTSVYTKESALHQ